MSQNTIKIQRTVSMGHRLPSYPGICSSPHGHNIRVELCVVSEGFLDFKLLDHILQVVLEPFDHAMVLWEKDVLLDVLRGMGFRTVALNVEPTTENVAAAIYREVSKLKSGRFTMVSVTVHETDKYSAICYREVPTIQIVEQGLPAVEQVG